MRICSWVFNYVSVSFCFWVYPPFNLYMSCHDWDCSHWPISLIAESGYALNLMILYFLALLGFSLVRGYIMTGRWSDGYPPFPSSFSRGSSVTGGWKNACKLVMMRSSVASGFLLVGTWTTWWRSGDRLRIGPSLSLFRSPEIRNFKFDPYLEHKIW